MGEDCFAHLRRRGLIQADPPDMVLLDVFMPGNGLLKGGLSSSPTLAGKYIYIWGNQGGCVVLEPGRTFKQVAKNRLENFIPGWKAHQEATNTEPVFEGKRMYFRGEYTLYCIGE